MTYTAERVAWSRAENEMINWIIGGAILAVYFASPYYALFKLQHAVQERDVPALNDLVHWPSVRQSLKSQINALIDDAAASRRSSDAFSAASTAMAKKMASTFAGPVLDNLSAETLFGSDQGPFTRPVSANAPPHFSWAFFTTPLDFKIQFPSNSECFDKGPVVMLAFMLTSWKVSEVRIPRPTRSCSERQESEMKAAVNEINRQFTKSMDDLNDQLRRLNRR